jgi:AcrR family transcriptional regulator
MDPRVDRTHRHVLDTALSLLANDGADAVTFSNVAREARVSRATLYRHWKAPEQLLAEVITQAHRERREPPTEPPDPGAFLLTYLRGVREGMSEPAMQAALAAMMGHATREERSRETLRAVNDQRHAELETGWGPLDGDEYAQIVGPIVFLLFLARKPITDDLLAELVEQALRRREQG